MVIFNVNNSYNFNLPLYLLKNKAVRMYKVHGIFTFSVSC